MDELALLILRALRKEAQHSYSLFKQITQAMETYTDGTFYAVLFRLENAGLVEGSTKQDGERVWRYYAITDAGRQELLRS